VVTLLCMREHRLLLLSHLGQIPQDRWQELRVLHCRQLRGQVWLSVWRQLWGRMLLPFCRICFALLGRQQVKSRSHCLQLPLQVHQNMKQAFLRQVLPITEYLGHYPEVMVLTMPWHLGKIKFISVCGSTCRLKCLYVLGAGGQLCHCLHKLDSGFLVLLEWLKDCSTHLIFVKSVI